MNAEEGKLVCVTGASGYIASWLVKELLLRGYAVKASVRNLNDPKKTDHLLKLEGAKERLHLFEADLMKEGSFDSAINGCEAVFHTASPCFAAAQDPQRELLEPAVKGTLNVLASCANNSSVKRVIVTSSVTAIVLNDNPKTPQTIVDETWFSDPEYCRKRQSWYALSKTLAEEAAWKFAREKGLDLISINPGMVIGPLLQPTLNHSCETILNLINGSKTYQNFTHSWVHVKDVVETHIRAFEEPSASGRYYLAESVLHYREIVQILKEIYPHLQVPTKCDDDKPLMPTYQIAKEKVKSLGIDYIPFKIGLQETFESLKEKKFVTF